MSEPLTKWAATPFTLGKLQCRDWNAANWNAAIAMRRSAGEPLGKLSPNGPARWPPQSKKFLGKCFGGCGSEIPGQCRLPGQMRWDKFPRVLSIRPISGLTSLGVAQKLLGSARAERRLALMDETNLR